MSILDKNSYLRAKWRKYKQATKNSWLRVKWRAFREVKKTLKYG